MSEEATLVHVRIRNAFMIHTPKPALPSFCLATTWLQNPQLLHSQPGCLHICSVVNADGDCRLDNCVCKLGLGCMGVYSCIKLCQSDSGTSKCTQSAWLCNSGPGALMCEIVQMYLCVCCYRNLFSLTSRML